MVNVEINKFCDNSEVESDDLPPIFETAARLNSGPYPKRNGLQNCIRQKADGANLARELFVRLDQG